MRANAEWRCLMGLHSFLSADSRQVWALDRFTGESVYLGVGEAKSMRLRAQVRLRCPFPDCVGPITTVSGSRRHHFRHLADYEHVGGPESLHHIEAKVMLADWFRQAAPPDTTVAVEARMDGTTRIADVLVRVPGRRPLAVEVEYKSFTIDEALRKHADYSEAGIDCLWLVGHTRLRGPVGAADESSGLVSVPAFAGALASSGAHVLTVNPSTMEVGVFSNPGLGDHAKQPWSGQHNTSHVTIDPLADCTYDADGPWLITPEQARQRVAVREREEQERAEANARATAEQAARDRRLADFRARNSQRPSTETEVVERLFDVEVHARTPNDAIFGVDPDIWKSALVSACVEGRANWQTFGWSDIRIALSRAGIGTGRWNNDHFDTVRAFLDGLEADGWIFVVSGKEFAASGKRRWPGLEG